MTDPRDAVVSAAKLILRLHECCVCGDVLMPDSTLPYCDMPRCFPVDGEDEEDSPDSLVESLRSALRALDAAGAEAAFQEMLEAGDTAESLRLGLDEAETEIDRLRAELAKVEAEKHDANSAIDALVNETRHLESALAAERARVERVRAVADWLVESGDRTMVNAGLTGDHIRRALDGET